MKQKMGTSTDKKFYLTLLIVIIIFGFNLVMFILMNFLAESEHQLRWNIYDNWLGSLLAGLSLAAILFFLKEYIFNVDISGEWLVEEVLENTSHSPYKGYLVYYKFHLLQTKETLIGYGEKTHQIEHDNNKVVFERSKRVRVDIDGFINIKFLKSTEINLLIYEKGRERHTSSTYTLKITKTNQKLEGRFTSTAADSSGPCILTRTS